MPGVRVQRDASSGKRIGTRLARGTLPRASHRRRLGTAAALADEANLARNPLRRNLMKAVVIGESSGASREAIMAVYPRHKIVVDQFIAQGVVVGIGPFTDGAIWPFSR